MIQNNYTLVQEMEVSLSGLQVLLLLISQRNDRSPKERNLLMNGFQITTLRLKLKE
jgi:hypothetical protein